ncbi:MAG: hypothetical protein ACFCGT_09340 [Sandaracinaceae bacterium]
MARLIGPLLAALVAACGATTVRTGPSQARFVVEPADARVYLEDRFLGNARVLAERPASFRTPGVRYFTIRRPGFFPHDVAVHLTPGVTTVRVTLRPRPP